LAVTLTVSTLQHLFQGVASSITSIIQRILSELTAALTRLVPAQPLPSALTTQASSRTRLGVDVHYSEAIVMAKAKQEENE
jgi:hypothetical protein